MTTDKREAEITSPDSRLIEELRYLRGPDHTAACGVAAVKLIERLQRENELLFADRDQQDAEIDTLRQSLSDALAIAQDWERQSRAAADSLLLVGMERDSLRQSLSAAEATIAAQAELAEKRRDEIEAAEARVKELEGQLTHSIKLTPHEIQSNYDRVKFAEGLIRQLPQHHDGRNTWLLNYGRAARASD